MKFTESHEWIRLENQVATVGISEFAQKELGDIVYVELPNKGHIVQANSEAAVLESTKSAVAIYTPLSGEIIEVNTQLREFPEKINQDAEKQGWLFKLKVHDLSELNTLMDEFTYKDYIHRYSPS